MRVTGIRKTKDASKPTNEQLTALCELIVNTTAKVGFLTNAVRLTGSGIKIGLHMSSFRVNTGKCGYNARIGRYIDSPKGYKRTDVPTWDQRVEFNNIVNAVFDKLGYTANIKSGPFTVRNKYVGAFDESHWENETPSHLGYHGSAQNGMGETISEITTEAEARERQDSDALEAEHKTKLKEKQRASSKIYRERVKVFRASKRVKVDGFYNYYAPEKTKNGKLLTHTQFEKLLSKLTKYEYIRVKSASVKATAEMSRQEKFGIKLETEVNSV